MDINTMEFLPATEAIQYASIKPNMVYRNQKSMYLPKGEKSTNKGGAVFMLTPDRESSMDVINGNYVLFYKSGYKIYSTSTRYAERIGSRQIRGNHRSEYRKDFMENRSTSLIRFKTSEELVKTMDTTQDSFIYDLGAWHQIFFTNRYFRTTKLICQDYMNFLSKRINELPIGSYNHKVIFIPVNKWFKHDTTLGIRKRDLTNPLSIILLCLYRFPDLLSPIANNGYDLLIVDEEGNSYLKTNLNSFDPKSAKQLYQRLKMQFKKMSCFKVIDEDDALIEQEASPTEEKVEAVVNMTKRLTGDPTKSGPSTNPKKIIASSMNKPNAPKTKEEEIINVLNDIDETPEESEEVSTDAMDDSEINEENIDEEIAMTVATAVGEDDALSDGTYSKGEAEAIVADKVKRDVFISKFIPTRSAKATANIERYAKKQEEVIKQTIPEMKSKIIDTSSYENVLDIKNENIKESRFANFEKSYIEKKLKPDLVNGVAKLSEADMPLFIEDIEIQDTSDVMNQKETYTYHLVDEEGRKHKIVIDIPKVIDNTYVYLGGNKKTILKQRINRPIVKIKPDTVQICTWYNKCMITRYGNAVDSKTTAIGKRISGQNHYKKYNVIFGNAKVRNKKYRTSLDFDYYSRTIVEATIGDTRFIFDLPKLEEEMKKAGIKEDIIIGDKLACGITSVNGKPTVVRCSVDGNDDTEGTGINDILLSKFPQATRTEIGSTGKGGRSAYARMTVLAKKIPVVFFMCFCEGFTKAMSDCGITYDIYDNTKENRRNGFGPNKGYIETMDKLIVYDKYPYENSLLMNGFSGLPIHSYTFEQLDSKDTWIDMVPLFYSSVNMSYPLSQFKDFLLDDAAKEMLRDFNQPTELVPLLFYAVQLLVNNQYVSDTDMTSVRVRSTEIIPNIAYDCIVNAYGRYRQSRIRGSKGTINVPRNEVIKAISQSSLIDDASVANPIMTLEKRHTCTVKGSTSLKGVNLGGQNKTNGMTMARRSYDPTMVGIFGITGTPDAEVGIKRFLTIEPNITSTRGYIESSAEQDLDSLNSANLFTFSESLTPPSVRHDDPPRTGMMFSQSTHMVMVEDSSPVLIGNHVESIVPYHMSGEFCFVAKKSGSIVDVKKGIYIVKYDDGTFDSFDTNPIIHKNSSEGTYTEVKFTCDHQVGYKFKKNEVLAADKRAFTQDENGLSASMNIGVLAKVAIMSTYDIYEDSEPVTKKLSERLATTVIHMHPITLNAGTYIDKMVKIGDKVATGDPLVKFDANSGDPEIEEFLSALKDRDGIADELVESSQTTIKSDESGEIADIRVYSTVPVNQLSPTLQKLVKEYHGRVQTKSNILEKYRNPTDNDFYKCGQLLNETTEVTQSDYGKIKGNQVGEGVLIEVYIKSIDIVKKGDKNTNYCALKGVTSHVIEEGQEPFSEFRPDEEVSAFVAPLSILSRKTPSVFTNLFGNKVLIELKRKLKEDYLSD